MDGREVMAWAGLLSILVRRIQLFAKGCGFFVLKWVGLGMSKVWELFQTRSSLFSR